MEVEIRRRETTGAGTSAHSDTETLAKYEIMDGAPVRGESIPIRHVVLFDGGTIYIDRAPNHMGQENIVWRI